MRLFDRLLPAPPSASASAALLVLRLVVGIALANHGWGKIQNPFHWMDKADAPAPAFFQLLAALSEFGGGIAFVLGLVTPLAALGVLCTMLVAISTHLSRGDPFTGKSPAWELAGVYAAVALVLGAVGPGALSADALLRRRLSRR